MSERARRKDQRNTRQELAEGERFKLRLVYRKQPSDEMIDHPSYKTVTNDSRMVGRIVPGGELDIIYSPVVTHPATSLEVDDKSGKKTVDVLALLPPDWQIVVVELPEDMLAILRALGQDITRSPWKEAQTQRLPLTVLPERKIITLPTYRLKMKYKDQDSVVEQLVYNVGVARAVDRDDVDTHMDSVREGRKFLTETLGGNLRMDQMQ